MDAIKTLGGLVVCGWLASGLVGCKPPVERAEVIRPVRAVKVADGDALSGRRFPGRAKATQEVNLSFRVAGPLITRPAQVGDVVETGAVLATIDPRDFEVELRNVEGEVGQSKAALALAEEEFARAQVAHDKQAVSELELSRRREAANAAKSKVEALEAKRDAAADNLAYSQLKAPYDGQIVAIYVENFEDVVAKQAIMRLLDDSRIEMIIDIPERMISLAEYVEQVWVTFDPFPDKELSAEIKEVGTEASAVTRTYPVTLIMDQPEGFKILPGMTGEAWGRVRNDAVPDAGFPVPVTALAATGVASSHVWVVDEQSLTVSKREVQLGAMTVAGIRVTGVEPGEWVATAGVHYLEEGQQVTILDTDVAGSQP